MGKAALRASGEQERRLVEAAQNDPARFADLYEENFERVYAFVARRVQDRDRAEDLTSDVFYKALAALPQNAGKSRVSGLTAVARPAETSGHGVALRRA